MIKRGLLIIVSILLHTTLNADTVQQENGVKLSFSSKNKNTVITNNSNRIVKICLYNNDNPSNYKITCYLLNNVINTTITLTGEFSLHSIEYED
ncbi:MAG: hypothetical protein LBQ34_03230 [Alphaproteobacteria bacterium]|jgi:hypothetical protein|nr:hypothetical protein [Alphaproteobacteria bacterium]